MEENEYFKLGISRVFDKLLCTSQKDDEVTLFDIITCQNILSKEDEIKEKVIRKNICQKLNVEYCYIPGIVYNNTLSFYIKKYLCSDFSVCVELTKDEENELLILESTSQEYTSKILDNAKEEVNEYYNFKEEETLTFIEKKYNINIDSNTNIIIKLNSTSIELYIYFENKLIMYIESWYRDYKFDTKHSKLTHKDIKLLIDNLFIKIKDLPPYMQEELYNIRKKQLNHKEKNREKINKLILKSKKQKHF